MEQQIHPCFSKVTLRERGENKLKKQIRNKKHGCGTVIANPLRVGAWGPAVGANRCKYPGSEINRLSVPVWMKSERVEESRRVGNWMDSRTVNQDATGGGD